MALAGGARLIIPGRGPSPSPVCFKARTGVASVQVSRRLFSPPLCPPAKQARSAGGSCHLPGERVIKSSELSEEEAVVLRVQASLS